LRHVNQEVPSMIIDERTDPRAKIRHRRRARWAREARTLEWPEN
jgi:hypothetical protein